MGDSDSCHAASWRPSAALHASASAQSAHNCHLLPDRRSPGERYPVLCQGVPPSLDRRLTASRCLRRVRHWPPVIMETESHRMNPVGVNSWVRVLPPMHAAIAAIALRVKVTGLDLRVMGVENPGEWDPAHVAEILAATDLSASACPVMGEGRDLLEQDL